MIPNTPDAASHIAGQLASFAQNVTIDILPAIVVEWVKLLMLDALASSQQDFAYCAYRGLQVLGGAGDSAVMGTFAPLPLCDAVLIVDPASKC